MVEDLHIISSAKILVLMGRLSQTSLHTEELLSVESYWGEENHSVLVDVFTDSFLCSSR